MGSETRQTEEEIVHSAMLAIDEHRPLTTIQRAMLYEYLQRNRKRLGELEELPEAKRTVVTNAEHERIIRELARYSWYV